MYCSSEPPHQLHILLAFLCWLIVIAGSSHLQQFALASYTDVRVRWLNQGSLELNGSFLIFFPSVQ